MVRLTNAGFLTILHCLKAEDTCNDFVQFLGSMKMDLASVTGMERGLSGITDLSRQLLMLSC